LISLEPKTGLDLSFTQLVSHSYPRFRFEIELYELLNLDAEGIDDPEFLQADEILDE